MTTTYDPRVKALLARHDRMEEDRAGWEKQWEDVSQYVFPGHKGTFSGGGRLSGTKGDRKYTGEIYDSTAVMALPTYASVLESMLAPRSQRWHSLVPVRPSFESTDSSRRWFDGVTDVLFRARYSPSANYASQLFQHFLQLGGFGTACTYVGARPGGGLFYRSIDLGEVFIEANFMGLIDRVHRRFEMTARDIAQMVAVEGGNLPERVASLASETNTEATDLELIQCVYPNEKRGGKWPIVSVLILRDTGDIIQESGYNTMPFIVSRDMAIPGEVYGSSPAIRCLAAIRTANEQARTLMNAGQRAVAPVLLAHDDGVLDTPNLTPGAVNFGGVSAEGRALIHALPVGNVPMGLELLQLSQMEISKAFLVQVFQILVETPRMTATEVLSRAQEKAALLAPAMGRQQTELLGPMIQRELDLLNTMGELPSAPPELRGLVTFDVQYDSPLSRAQRAEHASGLFRVLELMGAYTAATQDPSVYEELAMERIVPDIGQIHGMPTAYLSTPEEKAAKQAARMQQAQVQQAMQMGPVAADMLEAARE